MNILCPNCKKTTHLQQKYPYHAGFSDIGFLYCNSCPAVCLFSSYNKHYERVVGQKHPWSLTPVEKQHVENHLRPCKCGGQFCFNAYPKCPHCNGDLSSLLPDNMHFFEIGQVVDADKEPDVWL